MRKDHIMSNKHHQRQYTYTQKGSKNGIYKIINPLPFSQIAFNSSKHVKS